MELIRITAVMVLSFGLALAMAGLALDMTLFVMTRGMLKPDAVDPPSASEITYEDDTFRYASPTA